jgi:hypothetical protein
MTFLKVCSALNIDIDFKESKKSHAGAWLRVDVPRGARSELNFTLGVHITDLM